MRKTASPWRSNATSSAAKPSPERRGRPRAASRRQTANDRLVAAAPLNARRRDRGADHGRLILVEARHALVVQLRVVDAAAFLAHARLPEGPVGLQQLVVARAFDDVSPRRPVAEIAPAGLRAIRHDLRVVIL